MTRGRMLDCFYNYQNRLDCGGSYISAYNHFFSSMVSYFGKQCGFTSCDDIQPAADQKREAVHTARTA